MQVECRIGACVALTIASALLAPTAVAADGDGLFEQAPMIRGFVDETIAYTTAEPRRWSRGVTRLQLSADGRFAGGSKWRIGGRVDVDPVISGSDFYLDPVKRDQRADFFWRETFVDFSAGEWDFRVGAQNIIWGEVAGLFFADVVSARDLRDFLLPSFDIIRIPQWALRAERFAGDSHFELVWIPVPAFDNIGKPGADFYPVALGGKPAAAEASLYLDPKKPTRSAGNGNFGVRANTLIDGWDIAGFYYRSFATSPTFYRVATGSATVPYVFEPRYDRIWQVGSTVTKDLGNMVLRAEAVYASGQRFSSLDPEAADGVVERRTLDWIVSVERPFETMEGRVNVQVFQRHYFGGSADEIAVNAGDWGASLLISTKLSAQWEPSVQWLQAFGGGGGLIRPKLTWTPGPNLSVAFGADIFNGARDGFFGRYADKDRAYVQARYSF